MFNIQKVMGHRSVAFTLTVYGHIFDDDLDDLAVRLDGWRVTTLDDFKSVEAEK